MIEPTAKIWHQGKFIDWDDAKVHVLTHALHYGSSVFEGIRCYDTLEGPAIFRAKEHARRLFDSAKIYRMEDLGFTQEELVEAMRELVRVNGLSACYIRPITFRGYGEVGVLSLKNPIVSYMMCWEWGKYLGAEAIDKGVDVCVSSWTRLAPNTLPAMAKVAANYMNSQLIKMEAVTNGNAEGIALDATGYVSEGSGENIFLVRDGVMYTPTLGTSALPGITRATVLQIASDLGYEVTHQAIPREWLYIADELFFTGTAAEITPIRSVDRIKIGKGERGPITKRLQEEFTAIVTCKKEDRHGWLTFVNAPKPVSVS
jgi:branched-chain amino acid aminotransferase